jgi:hypothetical protein
MARHAPEDHRQRRGNGSLRHVGTYAQLLTDLVDLGWPEMLLHCVGNGHAASIAE